MSGGHPFSVDRSGDIWSMGILDIISRLVGIVTGLLTIAEKCNHYIQSKKCSEKDPSASLQAPDGSGDNSTK